MSVLLLVVWVGLTAGSVVCAALGFVWDVYPMPRALWAEYLRRHPEVAARREHRRAVRRAGRSWKARHRSGYDPNVEAARVGSLG